MLVTAAHLVRDAMEDFVFSKSPVDFSTDDLQGACGVASLTLVRVLRRLGFTVDFMMGHFDSSGNVPDQDDWNFCNHCWVQVPSHNLIIDVTATQFSIPSRVYLTEMGDWKYTPVHRNRLAVRSLGRWQGQSHTWYLDELRDIVSQVTGQVKETLRCSKFNSVTVA